MILAKLMGLFIIILIKWYFIFYLLLSCHQPSKNLANIHRKAMAFCFNEQINAIHVLSNLKSRVSLFIPFYFPPTVEGKKQKQKQTSFFFPKLL